MTHWRTFYCPVCLLEQQQRVNTKAGPPEHWCKRQSGKYVAMVVKPDA